MLDGHPHRFFAIARFSDDLDAGNLTERPVERGAEQALIVYDQNADHPKVRMGEAACDHARS